MDRAHRLGQTKPVTVYRLITRKTVEERIMARARQKATIQNLVIEGGNFEMSEEQIWSSNDLLDLLIEDEDANSSKKRKSAPLTGFVPRRKKLPKKQVQQTEKDPNPSNFTKEGTDLSTTTIPTTFPNTLPTTTFPVCPLVMDQNLSNSTFQSISSTSTTPVSSVPKYTTCTPITPSYVPTYVSSMYSAVRTVGASVTSGLNENSTDTK